MDSNTSLNSTSPNPGTNGTSIATIITCNSISILTCFLTLSLYLSLLLHRKYRRLMRRTSLVLAACMASSDLVLHCANIGGYGPLPSKWACAIVGGALFAAPTALSTFYSCCIALNSQLVFVFQRRPSTRALRYYVSIPLLVCLIIYGSALGTNSFGYDKTWGYCWYATEGVSPRLVLLRIIFTYCLPTLLCMLYLFIATVTISFAVFRKQSNIRGLPMTSPLDDRSLSSLSGNRSSSQRRGYVAGGSVTSPKEARPSSASSYSNRAPHGKEEIRSPATSSSLDAPSSSGQHVFPPSHPVVLPSSPASPARAFWALTSLNKHRVGKVSYPKDEDHPPLEAKARSEQKLSRRTLVLRKLTIRLIGYIVTPILCLLPGIILDLLAKVFPDMHVPPWLNGLFDGLNGLVGLFNSILMLSDPSLLVVWEDFSLTLHKARCRCTGHCEGRDEERMPAERRIDGKSNTGHHARAVEESMMSGFARTRIDDLEVNGTDHGRHLVVSQWPGDEAGVHEEPYTPVDGKYDEGREAAIGQGTERPLEIRVTVDVAQTTRRRRLSRVELIENWLSGL
ncbi:hypothetical protein FRC20_005637 [Serendipita sp. 405]|nr:hypothetical protein FRC20_005637 [Serendipita sp. 405]